MSSFHSSTSRIFQRNDDAAWRVVTAAYRNAAEKTVLSLFFCRQFVYVKHCVEPVVVCGRVLTCQVRSVVLGVLCNFVRVVQWSCAFPSTVGTNDGGSASSYSPSSVRHLSVDHNSNGKGRQLWTYNEWFAFLFTSRPLRSISLMCVCSNELQHNHFGLIGATG